MHSYSKNRPTRAWWAPCCITWAIAADVDSGLGAVVFQLDLITKAVLTASPGFENLEVKSRRVMILPNMRLLRFDDYESSFEDMRGNVFVRLSIQHWSACFQKAQIRE